MIEKSIGSLLATSLFYCLLRTARDTKAKFFCLRQELKQQTQCGTYVPSSFLSHMYIYKYMCM